MYILNSKILMAGLLLLASSNLLASSGNAGSVFNFQQKLAAKGNVQAQYQSGFMYETGEGVEKDVAQARQWYQKAADQGHLAAKYRLTYLDIRQNGYHKKQHADWLKAVKGSADIRHQEVLFLLGQMYREGIGVRKNLSKALDIMYQLGLEGMTAADSEIEKIQAELKARERKRKQAQLAKAKSVKAKADTKKQAAATASAARKAPASTTVAASKAAQDREARRRHYEAIMKKLADEEAEIKRLQGWVEGKDAVEVDDEI